MAGISDVARKSRDQGVEFFLASFVEMNGSSKAKLVPAEHLESLAEEGAGFAGFAAGELGQGPHDPDIAAIPDLDSFTILPWRPNVAWMAGNITVNGKQWPYCPRTILQRMRSEARDAGYVFKCGVEAEFFLVKRNGTGIDLADPLDRLAKPCYDQATLTRNLDFLTTLIRYMQGLGWSPYANDHEDANCQFEINWQFGECLQTADRHTFFKYMVRVLAEQHGVVATFMPKPFSHLTGSGAHFHMSLWDASSDQNLFLDESDPNGLSTLAYEFIGGLKAHARGLSALTAPTVNSYKRLVAGAPRSGATWAPVYVTYGGNNRTQMLRIPAPGRVENRAVDGSANPYLAAAGILAAGMDGIRNHLPAGQRNDRNMYEVPLEDLRREGIQLLPATLDEAVSELENDPVLMAALGPSTVRPTSRPSEPNGAITTTACPTGRWKTTWASTERTSTATETSAPAPPARAPSAVQRIAITNSPRIMPRKRGRYRTNARMPPYRSRTPFKIHVSRHGNHSRIIVQEPHSA